VAGRFAVDLNARSGARRGPEGGALPVGTGVVAILGGMGRTRNGSYGSPFVVGGPDYP
jgi:hypothetical protein